jgi:hypothetical protein
VTDSGVPEVGLWVPARREDSFFAVLAETRETEGVTLARLRKLLPPDLDAAFDGLVERGTVLRGTVEIRDCHETLFAGQVGGWRWCRWPRLDRAVAHYDGVPTHTWLRVHVCDDFSSICCIDEPSIVEGEIAGRGQCYQSEVESQRETHGDLVECTSVDRSVDGMKRENGLHSSDGSILYREWALLQNTPCGTCSRSL